MHERNSKKRQKSKKRPFLINDEQMKTAERNDYVRDNRLSIPHASETGKARVTMDDEMKGGEKYKQSASLFQQSQVNLSTCQPLRVAEE